ncbi:FAD-dependent oxidoreductase, partial [Falsiroseomonas selenitidurans]
MQIGIVGAGLCGLAAAAFLARKGHGVTVLERAVMPRPVGAGLLLQPPGMAILQRLGVRDALVAGGARITRLDSRTSDGRVLLDLRYADLAPGLHGLGLGRPAIWSALHGAASAAGARILSACEVRHVTALSDAALAQMANGTQQEFDLLVVAAGAHARFWQARPGHLARLYPWGCLWATISLPPDWPRDVLQQRCVGTQVMVGILPTGPVGVQAKAALYWSVRNDQVPALRQRPIDLWPAAGLVDTWIRFSPNRRPLHGTKDIQPRVQARG